MTEAEWLASTSSWDMLDCLRKSADRQSAFLVMPYGKKTDPRTGLEIDCDVVFDRVYVPVLEDLDYRDRKSVV